MEQCWRWFGPDDPISLEKVAQAGATGVVTALHDVPTGEIWGVDRIAERNEEIQAAGLRWSVVESVPIHADIQKGGPARSRLIRNYQQTIRNLASADIDTICYNFMPIVDWTRTDLEFELDHRVRALRFDAAEFAAYDLFVLERPDAEADYDDDLQARARRIFDALTDEQKRTLEKSIIAGLPGGEGSYLPGGDSSAGRRMLLAEIAEYRQIGEAGLRRNLDHFLNQVVPVAEENDIALAVHPDDPPFPLFGVPRIVSTADDVRRMFAAVDSPYNGLTLCAGSFGARADNNLSGMAAEFGDRVHFVHLRNVIREEDGSFYESEHLRGDNDLVDLIDVLLEQEERRRSGSGSRREIPMRPDHGHTMGDELEDDNVNPGYSYVGRLRGLAELRGVIHALERRTGR